MDLYGCVLGTRGEDSVGSEVEVRLFCDLAEVEVR